MPGIPQGHDAASKDPAKLLTHIFREITGVQTSGSRNAIPDDKVYNLENIIPIGSQNAQVVADISNPLFDFTPYGIVYWGQPFNITGSNPPPGTNDDGILFFTTNGNTVSPPIGSSGNLFIPTSTPLSGSGSRIAQWSNTVFLIIDSTGLYAFDTTVPGTAQKITGPGVPTSGSEIAVYAGRVWIAQGRILFTSGAGDFHAASWLPQNGASFNVLIDPQLKSGVSRMVSANGVLYVYGASSVNIISNVAVPIGAVPPTPIYNNQNVQPIIGTDQPGSVIPFDQSILMANKYGVYKVYGVAAPKISDDIDGTWQYLDFTQSISGGQAVVEGILCAAFLIKRNNDPQFGSNTVVAMWFQKDGQNRWWFANYGNLTFIVTAIIGGIPTLFGVISNKLYQLFALKTRAPTTQVMTKLFPLEDDLAQKEAIRVGVLSRIDIYGSSISLTIDGLNVSQNSNITSSFSPGLWINNEGDTGLWIDDAFTGVTGGWIGQGYQLISGSAPGMFSHNLGFTFTATGYRYSLNFLALDYKLRDRWT